MEAGKARAKVAALVNGRAARAHALQKGADHSRLALHVAQLPGNIAGFVAAPTLEMPSEFKQAAATSTAEVLSAFDQSLAKAKDVLNGLDDATIMSVWTLKAGGKTLMSMPRLAVVRSLMLNHWYHHRGQLSVFLRLQNVPLPSIYGPTADNPGM